MANPLPPLLATGTLGEILVQLRLLQFGIQAAPPIKDSGNDLVAFRERTVRTVQVKTSANRVPRSRNLPRNYDILALVALSYNSQILELDSSRIFLLPRNEIGTRRNASLLARHELRHHDIDHSMHLLERLFDSKPAARP